MKFNDNYLNAEEARSLSTMSQFDELYRRIRLAAKAGEFSVEFRMDDQTYETIEKEFISKGFSIKPNRELSWASIDWSPKIIA